jgi:hypothetical protein
MAGEAPVAREQRKLAAILAADVVGYSRLMGRDESGTRALLVGCRMTSGRQLLNASSSACEPKRTSVGHVSPLQNRTSVLVDY